MHGRNRNPAVKTSLLSARRLVSSLVTALTAEMGRGRGRLTAGRKGKGREGRSRSALMAASASFCCRRHNDQAPVRWRDGGWYGLQHDASPLDDGEAISREVAYVIATLFDKSVLDNPHSLSLPARVWCASCVCTLCSTHPVRGWTNTAVSRLHCQ